LNVSNGSRIAHITHETRSAVIGIVLHESLFSVADTYLFTMLDGTHFVNIDLKRRPVLSRSRADLPRDLAFKTLCEMEKRIAQAAATWLLLSKGDVRHRFNRVGPLSCP
jgi:hypothetical protein